MMTKADKERFDQITRMGCIVCRQFHHVTTPAMVHHLTGIKYRGCGKKASNEHTIALCHTHHQGEQGIHTIGMRAWEQMFGTQESLLESTNLMLHRTH